jgi:chromosome segregation ATPase
MRSQALGFVGISLALLLLGFFCAPTMVAALLSEKVTIYGDRAADAYVLSRGHTFFSTNSSLEGIEALRSGMTGDFLWVRRAGKEFVIRDSRTLEEAQSLFDPMRRLDPERKALHDRQERLRLEQSALDREEQELDEELDFLEDAENSGDRASTRSDLERRRKALQPKMHALEARERELDAIESSLDSRADALEEKAEAALWKSIDRALAKGLGRPFRGD